MNWGASRFHFLPQSAPLPCSPVCGLLWRILRHVPVNLGSRWRPDTHHEHEHGVEDEGHGTEGLDGGHHVPLQAEREHDAQGHREEQEHAEGARDLGRAPGIGTGMAQASHPEPWD